MSTQFRFSSTGMKAKREKIQFTSVITKQDIINQLLFQSTTWNELVNFIKLLDQEAEDWETTIKSFEYFSGEIMTYIDETVTSNEEIDPKLVNIIERLYNNVHPKD